MGKFRFRTKAPVLGSPAEDIVKTVPTEAHGCISQGHLRQWHWGHLSNVDPDYSKLAALPSCIEPISFLLWPFMPENLGSVFSTKLYKEVLKQLFLLAELYNLLLV